MADNKKTDFIGRESELSKLEEHYKQDKAQVVLIYGKKHIGKTKLIKKFCESKKYFYYKCTQIDDKAQLAAFGKRMKKLFNNWEEAFSSFTEKSSKSDKSIFIIDNFTYATRDNKDFYETFNKVWNEKLKDENIFIILCTSSLIYAEKDLYEKENSLLPCITAQIRINELDFFETNEFLTQYNAHDQIVLYGIFGGNPKFLSTITETKDIKTAICTNFFEPCSIFSTECEYILKQEIREPATYNTIIQSIANDIIRFNELKSITSIEKCKLSVYIKMLIDMGILQKYYPLSYNKLSKPNIQSAKYKVADNLFRFYYAFILPNISDLEEMQPEQFYDELIAPKLNKFISPVFNDICIQWLTSQNQQQRLPFHFKNIGPWWNDDLNVDAIAYGEDNTKLLSIKCKFDEEPINLQDISLFYNTDLSPLKPKSKMDIFYYVFSSSGFSNDAISFAKKNGIRLINFR